ncbi:MAG TPA: cytochrome ubiquinol oxidase subunit I [Acidimicrobiia bacterium]
MIADDLLAAREQMAFTLGFHIILVPFGAAFPTITLIANWRGIARNDGASLELARRWSKVMGVLFAVGAVTGTVLSFEMGLLWPGLFGHYGAVVGVPFAIEGLAFFSEAIFIGIYLYGWNRMSPWAHFWSGIPIAIAGIVGTFSVIAANSWMNQPAGFKVGPGGKITDVSPLKGIFNRATAYEVPHMLLASYMVAGFVVASVYAVGMLKGRNDERHRRAFAIAFTVAAIATPLQIAVGDYAARAVFHDQPSKFAAMELTTHSGSHQALHLGGVLIDGKVVGGIPIPNGDSLLAGLSASTSIKGLDSISAAYQPPMNIVHLAFQLMVTIGFGLLALGVWFGLVWRRQHGPPENRWFLRCAACAGVAAVVALEAGWVTTEVGRQPWIAYRVMLTRDAVTKSGGVWFTFIAIVVLYTGLATATVIALRRMARNWRADGEAQTDRADDAPYGPRPEVASR